MKSICLVLISLLRNFLDSNMCTVFIQANAYYQGCADATGVLSVFDAVSKVLRWDISNILGTIKKAQDAS